MSVVPVTPDRKKAAIKALAQTMMYQKGSCEEPTLAFIAKATAELDELTHENIDMATEYIDLLNFWVDMVLDLLPTERLTLHQGMEGVCKTYETIRVQYLLGKMELAPVLEAMKQKLIERLDKILSKYPDILDKITEYNCLSLKYAKKVVLL